MQIVPEMAQATYHFSQPLALFLFKLCNSTSSTRVRVCCQVYLVGPVHNDLLPQSTTSNFILARLQHTYNAVQAWDDSLAERHT